MVSSIIGGNEERSATIATTTTAPEQLVANFLSTSTPQQQHECLPPIITTTSRNESTVAAMAAAVEEGQQHQLCFETPAPSNETTTRMARVGRDDYSMAIHEIIYGCQEGDGDDEDDDGDADMNNYASQTEQGQMEEEEKQEIINDISLATLPPDDDNPSLMYNPSDNCCVKVECADNIASIDSNDPSRKEDGGDDDNESSNGNELEECNSVASDKAYYKDLCVRLTFALEKRKSVHRECRQEMRRIQREYSKLSRRFLDLQRSFRS